MYNLHIDFLKERNYMTNYRLQNTFMIREPVYDLKKYNSIFSKNKNVDQCLINLLKDKQFKEI